MLPENDERGKYLELDFGSNVPSSFLMEGFGTIQNIEDILTVEKCHYRASDPLTDRTEYTRADDDASSIKDNDDNANDAVKDIHHIAMSTLAMMKNLITTTITGIIVI